MCIELNKLSARFIKNDLQNEQIDDEGKVHRKPNRNAPLPDMKITRYQKEDIKTLTFKTNYRISKGDNLHCN